MCWLTLSTSDLSQNTSRAADNRPHVIQATLVRIMKSRKVLDVQELISEVTRQIKVVNLKSARASSLSLNLKSARASS